MGSDALPAWKAVPVRTACSIIKLEYAKYSYLQVNGVSHSMEIKAASDRHQEGF